MSVSAIGVHPGYRRKLPMHAGKKWVLTVAGAIGVLCLVLCGGAAAYGASRYVRRRISRKVGEASCAAATPVGGTLRVDTCVLQLPLPGCPPTSCTLGYLQINSICCLGGLHLQYLEVL
jgi:hypothetical protein